MCVRYITWFALFAPTKHSWDEYNLLGLRLVRLLGGVFVRRSMNPSTFVEVAPQALAASELVCSCFGSIGFGEGNPTAVVPHHRVC